jgi:hypothetical protein
MNTDAYLAALDERLREVEGLVASTCNQREIDANLGMGFIKGRITFVDGSTLEFSGQLPTERKKFRLHYMDAQNDLIGRWDSAPHHKKLSTFPFHKHTPQGAEEHGAITLLEAMDEIAEVLQV